MTQIPIQKETIDRIAQQNKIANPGKASIREMRKMIQDVEKETGVRFVKMEMGVPGLQPSKFGVDAQVKALQDGIARLYPNINGLPELKNEASRFVKAFIDVDINPEGCVPVCGSMQGTYASFMTVAQSDPKKNTILFIDPGFPVQKQQCVVMGANYDTFDVYVEVSSDQFSDLMSQIQKMEKSLESALRTMLGISPKVHLVAPKTITRSEGKAVRVIDKRKLH